MGIIPDVGLICAKVMHSRLKPKQNKFLYSVFYLSLSIESLSEKLGNWVFGMNRSALLSFHHKDHGEQGVPLKKWVSELLSEANIHDADINSVRLITMPRVLGYVFNPISFWVVPDAHGNMICMICEVNNTFGERHIYICAHDDMRPIQPDDILQARKTFHVSPFLKREGVYKFRFSYKENFFAAFVDYVDEMSDVALLTSVCGKIKQATSKNLLSALLMYPFMTMKVVFLIHWQALLIVLKGIKYIPKPIQLQQRHTTTENR